MDEWSGYLDRWRDRRAARLAVGDDPDEWLREEEARRKERERHDKETGLFALAGCPDLHRKMTRWKDYRIGCDDQREVRDRLIDAVRTPPEGHGRIFVLLGPPGIGKTQMGVLLCRTACHELHEARYVTMTEFLEDVRRLYRRQSEQAEADLRARYVRPMFLLLDDAQEKRISPTEHRNLHEIMDRRYGSAHKVTLIVSNESRSQYERNLSPDPETRKRILRRIAEFGSIMEAVGWPTQHTENSDG